MDAAQFVIGLVDLFEPLFVLGIAAVGVGMEAFDQLDVARLDLVEGDRLLEVQFGKGEVRLGPRLRPLRRPQPKRTTTRATFGGRRSRGTKP